MPSQDGTSPSASKTLPLRAIQAQVGGELIGNPELLITGVNALELAGPGELSFADSERYALKVRQTRASAIILPKSFPSVPGRTVLRVENPRLAFFQVLSAFHVPPVSKPGIHRSAVVAPDAELGPEVTVGECAVIRSRARIGARTVIESGVHIGEGVEIGESSWIGPNVVIAHGCRLGRRVILHGGVVIGADGFGYFWMDGRHVKIPQIGNVVIEDDLELGANVCVDRGTFGSTLIKRGTKVDNLVQIAHNDIIGEHVIMSGQVGLAGSVTVGDRAMFGGQAGVADHLKIGADARVGAKSAVIHDVRSGEMVWGYPARPIREVKRQLAALAFLPDLLKQFKKSGGSPPARPPNRRSGRA